MADSSPFWSKRLVLWTIQHLSLVLIPKGTSELSTLTEVHRCIVPLGKYDSSTSSLVSHRAMLGSDDNYERYGSMHHDLRRCLLLGRQASLNQRNNSHGGKHDDSKDEVKSASSHTFQ